MFLMRSQGQDCALASRQARYEDAMLLLCSFIGRWWWDLKGDYKKQVIKVSLDKTYEANRMTMPIPSSVPPTLQTQNG
jgi:hypothetical protein